MVCSPSRPVRTRSARGGSCALELALPETGGLIALPHEALYGTDRIYTIDEQSRMRPQRVERVGEWRDPDGDIRSWCVPSICPMGQGS